MLTRQPAGHSLRSIDTIRSSSKPTSRIGNGTEVGERSSRAAYVARMKHSAVSKAAPRWRVTVIAGARARKITELAAESAEAAIKRSIRQQQIEPERAKRLAAYRVG